MVCIQAGLASSTITRATASGLNKIRHQQLGTRWYSIHWRSSHSHTCPQNQYCGLWYGRRVILPVYNFHLLLTLQGSAKPLGPPIIHQASRHICASLSQRRRPIQRSAHEERHHLVKVCQRWPWCMTMPPPPRESFHIPVHCVPKNVLGWRWVEDCTLLSIANCESPSIVIQDVLKEFCISKHRLFHLILF